MRSLTISLALPPRNLRGNACPFSRGAALARAVAVKEYRSAAYWRAREAMRGEKAPVWEKARVRVLWHLPRNGKQQDPDNMLRSLKSAFDGLQDAGVIANDRNLIHLPPEFARDPLRPRVEITVEEHFEQKGVRPIAQ